MILIEKYTAHPLLFARLVDEVLAVPVPAADIEFVVEDVRAALAVADDGFGTPIAIACTVTPSLAVGGQRQSRGWLG